MNDLEVEFLRQKKIMLKFLVKVFKGKMYKTPRGTVKIFKKNFHFIEIL